MADYSCENCINLKTKLITKKDTRNIRRGDIQQAIRKHDTESLGLSFPFNLTVYNRLKKHGECKVLYCTENMFNRELYIYRDNMDLDSIVPVKLPCPKYK